MICMTVSASSGVMHGRTRPPVSISMPVCLLGRWPSRLYQCTKSPEPQSRHFPRTEMRGNILAERIVRKATRLRPQG